MNNFLSFLTDLNFPIVKFAWLSIFLGSLYAFEGLYPLFKNRTGRGRHALGNAGLGIINVIMTHFVFATIILVTMNWTNEHQFGLLSLLKFPPEVELILALIIFDAWMYVWHRVNHVVPFLWRFHRVHHSDLAMDCSSALRFHVGEIALSHSARLLIIPLLGMNVVYLFVYEMILQPVVGLHHSNVALPFKWDSLLRLVFVSPNMHRVHHSQVVEETNSNYSSVFSFWDRLGRSYKQRQDITAIRFGVKEFQDENWQSLWGMLKTPLALFAVIILCQAPSRAQEFVIDRFSAEMSTSGTPKGWEELTFKKIKAHTKYELVTEEDNYFIKAESKASASGLLKKLTLSPKKLPIFKWRWKVQNILEKADARKKSGDDYSARIYVAFKYDSSKAGFFTRLKYGTAKLLYGQYPPKGALNYVWGSKLPVGTEINNAYTAQAKMIVVQSGEEKLGQWVSEQENIYEDYLRLFGEEPPEIEFVAIMTDTDNTGDSAIAYFDDLVFTSDKSKP